MAENNGKDLENRKKAWSLCASFLIVALAVGVLWGAWRAKKSVQPRAVVFGDSISAWGRGEDSVVDRLSEKSGIPFLNAAFGGTALSRVNAKRFMDDDWDFYSMASLACSVASNDFSPQQQAEVGEIVATEYFDELVDKLDGMDFRKLEIMILEYGMNDYQMGVPLDNPEDPYDTYSFGGALRYVLRLMKQRFPSCRILLVSPTYSWYSYLEKGCEEQDFGGGILEDYVLLEQGIAEEWHVEMIDLYHDLCQRESFDKWKQCTLDGLHPNEDGRELIAQTIAAYLEDNP